MSPAARDAPSGPATSTSRADRPRPRDANRPIAFLHVPRTAGSTVKETIQATVGVAGSLIDAHYYRPDPDFVRHLRFVEGHVGVGYFARVLGPDWSANGFTVLRDPIDRVVSQARHLRVRRRPADPDLSRRIRDPRALFEAVPRLCDHQTKILAGIDIDANEVDAGAPERARATLEAMTFGFTEHFDTTMALVCEHMDLWIARYGFSNVSASGGDRDLCSERFRREARDHNAHDIALDAFARDLFSRRVEYHVEGVRAGAGGDAAVTHELYVQGHPVADAIEVPAGLSSVRLAGWALVAGEVPDAAIVAIGDRVVPLAARLARPDAARRTHDARHRHAGFLGHVTIPRDVDEVALTFVDRARQRHAVVRLAVHHLARRPRRLFGRTRRSGTPRR